MRANYLGKRSKLATQHGTVLIFDEVITGFRVHPGGAQGHYGVTPDLTTLAKILDENKAKRGLICVCTAGGAGVTAILER